MKYTTQPANQNLGTWVLGSEDFDGERKLQFSAKVFEVGSEYGIDAGKISKLEIRLGNDILCNYDRGWDIEPTKEVRPFYESILAKFN